MPKSGWGNKRVQTRVAALRLLLACVLLSVLPAFVHADIVKLAWNANTESNIAGYNVYRSTTQGTGYARVNGALVSNNAFTDNPAGGITYYYVVTAVNTSNVESGFSNEVTVPLLPAPNKLPTASAGADQLVFSGQTVTLSGSGSDPDGDAIIFSWSQVSGPTVALINAATATATFTAPVVSVDTPAVFRLTVADTKGGTASDDMTVTIRQNRPPTADAGADQSVRPAQLVTLKGIGSDPDGDTLTFTWSQVSGPPIALTASGFSAFFTSPNVTVDTSLVFRLAVSDKATSTTDDVVVIVRANRPPTANAGPDLSVRSGDSVTLAGSGADPDNDPVTFAWTQLSGPPVTLSGSSSAAASFTAPSVTVDTALSFRLTTSDNRGASSSDDVVVTARANRPPTVSAGPDQIVDPGQNVNLQATASDPDGDPLTYAWTQLSGTGVVLSGAASATASFSAPLVDTVMVFQLLVSDGRGAAITDNVTVTVRLNTAPTANAGGDQIVASAQLVTLSGSGSDPDGDPITFSWTQVGGPTVTLGSAKSATATFVSPTVGSDTVLVFRLTVADNRGASASDDVIVTVRINRAPTVTVGPNQIVQGGQVVTLSGSGSDPDGDALTFLWTQVSGPSVALTGANTATAQFTALLADAVLLFRLTASDGKGGVASADVIVEIRVNKPPVVNAGSDQNVRAGDNVTLAGSASDPDGDSITFAWTQLAGPTVALSTTSAALTTFVAPSVPSDTQLVFRLTATDSKGLSGNDDVTVTVRPNLAPTANAGPDQTVASGQAVTLSGSGSDPEGDPVTFSWSLISGPFVALTGANTAQATFTSPVVTVATELVFRLTVRDNRGASSSDDVRVVVSSNRAPVVDAGPDQNVAPGSAVTLAASASDPDGDALTFLWTQISGTSVVLSGASTATATFVAPPVQSVLVFRLTVSDSRGGTAIDTVSVNVKTNSPPTADAGPEQVVIPGKEVTLFGSASDPDGDPLTYSWSQVGGTGVVLAAANTPSATFTAPLIDTTMTFRLTVSDNRGGVASDDVTVTVSASAERVLLVPLIGSSLPPPNPEVSSSLALLYPPVGTINPDNTPREDIRFAAHNAAGSMQEAPSVPLFWGQQIGLHADNILNLPALRALPAPTALEILSTAKLLEGFFLVYTSGFDSMDGVTSSFRLAKKLVLPGVRFSRDQAGLVARQTHVFIFNRHPEDLTVSARLISTLPEGSPDAINVTTTLKANAAFAGSLDTLFPSLQGTAAGYTLSPSAHVVLEAAQALAAMVIFKDADAISAAKGIVPEVPFGEGTGNTRILTAPFVTVSRTSSRPRLEKYDSSLTLYNADAVREAFVTIRAFSQTGQALFPGQPEVTLALKAASQITIPLLRQGAAAGLFSDDPVLPGPEPRNGYLEIITNQSQNAFGGSGTLNLHGFISTKFPGPNEMTIPLVTKGLSEAYFFNHVAHQTAMQGSFRQALAILNPSNTATTVKIEIFEGGSAASAQDRAKLGKPAYVGRISLGARQQISRFLDQLINEAAAIPGQPKPVFTSQLGGYLRLTSENAQAKLMAFCTYVVIAPDGSFRSLATIDAQPLGQ